jgi:hypothetical protein
MHVTGSCHCGAIAYEAEVDADRVGICHCVDCQKLAGSAYRVSVPTDSRRFRLLRGRPTVYVKTAASGARRAQVFCPTCGSPLYTYDVDAPQAHGLRVGCIDQRDRLVPARRIWCRSALPWSQDITALPCREQE